MTGDLQIGSGRIWQSGLDWIVVSCVQIGKFRQRFISALGPRLSFVAAKGTLALPLLACRRHSGAQAHHH